MSNFTVETKLVDAVVDTMSLIGTSRERPISWGNYFWVSEGRVVNMWAENLEHLVSKKVLADKKVLVNIYSYNDCQWLLVVDNRIPADYLYNELCFTGYYLPPIEIAQHMFDIVGDPTNQIEKWSKGSLASSSILHN